MAGFIRKQDWSKEDLKEKGFQQFSRKKEIVMARVLPDSEAPLTIRTRWGETLIAQAGYMICYIASETQQPNITDYDHWPVEAAIFAKTYLAWDEIFTPTSAQKHLMEHHCKPFYKAAGVWAKTLDEDVYIQGEEHHRPVLVEKDRVLTIGAEGEPYHMGAETFADRYDARLLAKDRSPLTRVVKRLVNFLKGE